MKKLLPIVLAFAFSTSAFAKLPSSGNDNGGSNRAIPTKDIELRQDVRAVEKATVNLQSAKNNLRNAETKAQKREAREDVKDAKNDLKRASKELREDLRDRKNGNDPRAVNNGGGEK